MDAITQVLFWISNSLLIPNIIALIVLFVYSLLLIGSFYNSFMTKRRVDALLDGETDITLARLREKRQQLHQDSPSLLVRYLVRILDRKEITEEYLQYQLSQFESDAEREVNVPRILIKVGPVLGLIGTLISMSPALVGLSSGDIESMAYNMQIVFATTVVGLVICLVGLITQQYKQRWFALDLARLEYVSAQLLETQKQEP